MPWPKQHEKWRRVTMMKQETLRRCRSNCPTCLRLRERMGQQINTYVNQSRRQETWTLFQKHLERVERVRSAKLNREEKVDMKRTPGEQRAREMSAEYQDAEHKRLYRASVRVTRNPPTAQSIVAEAQQQLRDGGLRVDKLVDDMPLIFGEVKAMTLPEYIKYGMRIKTERLESYRSTEGNMKIEHHTVMKHTISEIPLGVTVNELITGLNQVRGHSYGNGAKMKLINLTKRDRSFDLEFEAVS